MSEVESVWRAGLPPRPYECAVVPEDEPNGWDFYQAVRTLPRRQGPWTPIPLEVVNPLDGQQALRATIPCWLASKNVLVLRDEAIESVGSVLARHGELLPVDGRNARMVIFSAPLVADGLIEGESELHQSPGSIYVRLDRGVFDAGLIGELQAFVVPVGRGYILFLTKGLVREIEATGDTAGVVFEEAGVLRQGG
jgi:hypothetical protein